MKQRTKKRIVAIFSLCFLVLVSIAAQMILSGFDFENDKVVVWIFDVGQGDAIFIDAPEAQILIDGGPSGVILEKLSAVMPFWDRSIDLVVSTHPHADHITGLNLVLERYFVDEVWVTGQEYGTDAFAYFETLTPDSEIVSQGDKYDLGNGGELTVLWPPASLEGQTLDDANTGSLGILLTFGETTMFFPGDMGIDEEAQMLSTLPDVDVLKVGHQGSMTSTSLDFLEVAKPETAVIPVGENDYGHPSPIILERLRSFGAAVLRTDEDGDVRFVSDGGEPRVDAFDF